MSELLESIFENSKESGVNNDELAKENEVEVQKDEASPEEEPQGEEKKVEEPEEPEQEAEEPSAEEPRRELPFNANHPRFKRVWKELEELREWKAEQTRLQEEARSAPTQHEPTKMPPAFVALFGENEEAWQKFQELRELDKIDARNEIQRVIAEEQARQEVVERAEQQAVQAAEDEFMALSEETGVDLTDRSSTKRNQILDIVDKYQLFTPEGLPNISAAWELHKSLYPEKTAAVVEERRQVAAKTNTKTNSSAKESEYFTPSKLREIEKRGGIHFFKNS